MTIKRNLFCLPFAGGSAAIFQPWQRLAPVDIAVHPMALPGRGTQWGQSLLCEWGPVLDLLLAQVEAQADLPSVLFGHSMGALLAFELAHALRERGLPAPELLVLSASRPPRPPHRLANTPWLTCSTDCLMAELDAISGPSEALANPELRELMLPILRNDFQLCANYRYPPRSPLQVPILVLAGGGDAGCPLAPAQAAWAQETTEPVTGLEIDGGHLFITERPADVLAHVLAALPTCTRPAPPSLLNAYRS
ncbi:MULTISPECIES: thioesterase II family protein [Pseudomonas]|uniref:Thioesterase n=1 Tax=Pseudomonas quercus TaxID=2722792 RepID=A0ABX0YA92_9PSED|nr:MULTISPECIES: alpha/beta fold hydrolase [Pseudomonas]MBF7140782.1 thioesterase [Pseudomonas sp. LY10J]NJO99318.1 thioesterase [Pseudomonas quercus]